MTEAPTSEPCIGQGSDNAVGASMGSSVKSASTSIVSGTVIGVLLVLDFITPTAFEREVEWLMAVFVGVCIGQVNLIATWAVFAPGNIVVRLPWSLLLGMFMWYALVLGSRMHGMQSLGVAMLLGVIVLAGIVVAQIPLWIAKKAFRWRLTGGVGNVMQTSQEDRQFQLRHLLLGTFLLSLALSPLRLVLPPKTLFAFSLDGSLFVMLGAVTVCDLVITIPCIWGGLLASAPVIPLTFGWLLYCVLITLVEFATLVAMLGSPGDSNAALLFYLMNIAQCATVFGTLRIFRALGFRLVRAPICRPTSGGGT